MNFPQNIFRSRFDPKRGYQTVNKSKKKCQTTPGASSKENLSRVAFQTRSKIADAILIYIPDNQAPHLQY